MIRIVTDSASDYTQKEAIKNHIDLVYLHILFEDQDYDYINDDDFSVFYQTLAKSKSISKTSQPALGDFLKVYEDAKAKGDDVVVLCLSSGLSGTYHAAQVAQEMVEYDRIYVVDTKLAIISQRLVIDYAIDLRAKGKSAKDIATAIEAMKDRVHTFGAVDTLEYLYKGGRLSRTAAFAGSVLSIKPIIVLSEGTLSMENKLRGFKKAKRYLQNKLASYQIDSNFPVYFGYTTGKEAIEQFQAETAESLKLTNVKGAYPIGGVIGTHLGPNTCAIAFVEAEK